MTLYLKRREDKRIRAGHLWIYSNEVDTKKSPLKSFQAGQCVNVLSNEGRFLGRAYVNPHSLIAARIFDDRKNINMDEEWFQGRFTQALQLREKFFDKPFYRLLFSEGDYTPGLIVDRFDNTFVLQINTAGMEAVRDALINAIKNCFNPQQIILRNDSASRELEGLPRQTDVILGDADDPVWVEENNTRFKVDVINGQKTGWFYDQRVNRENMLKLVNNNTVLDVFSYTGSWAVPAAKAGANQVTAIDASQQSLDTLMYNAEQNAVQDKLDTLCDDAFNAMQQLKEKNKTFDIVLIDPPAFIKRKKDLNEGLQAYIRANRMAMNLVKPGALIISSSCSFHMSLANLQNGLLKASRKIGRQLQILNYGFQGPDHPIHPAIEETAYLKTIIARVN